MKLHLCTVIIAKNLFHGSSAVVCNQVTPLFIAKFTNCIHRVVLESLEIPSNYIRKLFDIQFDVKTYFTRYVLPSTGVI